MSKLTLTVDEQVVVRAKQYAAERGTSISALVESFLDLIVNPPRPTSPTPILDRWKGVLAGKEFDEEAQHEHWERKYR